MTTGAKFPLELGVRLALAIALDTAVQLSWKSAALRIPSPPSIETTVAAVAGQPLFIAVAILFALQLWNWVKVLELADLSFAQPITALSYVSVCVLSALYLGESIGAFKIAGIGLILAGVWFISRTDHVTRPGGNSQP
jgi:drug/metabolite transporter (DMT)-like permease